MCAMSITAPSRVTDAPLATVSVRPMCGVSADELPRRAPLALGQQPAVLQPTVLQPAVHAPTIATARLLLRPHTVSDADAWYRIQSDPEVVRYLPWPERTVAESRAHLQRRTQHHTLSRRNDFLALAVVRDGELIGDVSMHLRVVESAQREIEAGWLLSSTHSGFGYAREAALALLSFAFTQLRTQTASAVIDERNHRSLALAQRLGFIRQGRSGRSVRMLINHRMLLAAASAVHSPRS